MAEAIGFAGSVIAVLQVATQITVACVQYFQTAKNAKKSVPNVVNVVNGFMSVLLRLQELIEQYQRDPNDPRLRNLKIVETSFNICAATIEELAKTLGINIEATENPDQPKITFSKKITWPLKE